MSSYFEYIKNCLCDEINSNKPVIFLVGAGISYSSPTNLSLFPQDNCLKQLSSLKYFDRNMILEKIRPELFFQILLKHMGERDGLLPLKVLDTATARADGYSVEPNVIHYLLAALIHQGNIVISTNFDGLIEDAYQNLCKKTLSSSNSQSAKRNTYSFTLVMSTKPLTMA